VAKIESGFDPRALGGVGEVGLMQIRPQTAAMLGYGGDAAGLFEPETNVRFGVAYLARA
jgi:soluble lytic murein transglycosylase-like protein